MKQYFADRDIFCAGRVAEEDLKRVAAASGGTVQTSVNNIIDEVVHYLWDSACFAHFLILYIAAEIFVIHLLLKILGTCEVFEEKQVGNERFNIFNGCPSGQTATIVLRGGADQVCQMSCNVHLVYNYTFNKSDVMSPYLTQFIEEAERSLHDAIMIVRRALKNSTVVAGGGAIDVCPCSENFVLYLIA